MLPVVVSHLPIPYPIGRYLDSLGNRYTMRRPLELRKLQFSVTVRTGGTFSSKFQPTSGTLRGR